MGTPRARLIRETIRAWFGIFKTLTQPEILDLRAAWAVAKAALISSDKPINQVKGILSNVICILIQAKWSPSAFNVWRDDDDKGRKGGKNKDSGEGKNNYHSRWKNSNQFRGGGYKRVNFSGEENEKDVEPSE